MKNLFFAIVVLSLLAACAPKKDPTWNMSWSCNGGTYCITHVSPNSNGGNGSFSNETDCLAWEAAFLNTAGYYTGSVTACTQN